MSKSYYVSGNTVRELNPKPVRREQYRPSKEELEQQKRKKSRRNAARRNRERALHMNRGYVAFLTICVAVSAFASVTYIQLQSDVSARMRRISTLERQIADMKADNDAKYKEVTTSVDLNEIKDRAVNQLGMKYAAEEQIIYYTIDNNNFMDQYSEIPEK